MDQCESWVPQGSAPIAVLFLIHSNDLSENLVSNSIFLLKIASVIDVSDYNNFAR